ncbi:MAG: hypothetical protein GY812_17635, partial [Actinomycetia bacterium]|nr:hypothetical protein [Actinomycetes bacterium]
YLRKLREGGTAPFLTVGVAPVSYRSQGGPTFSQPRLEHGIGMAVRRDDWLVTGSIGWIPFASTRYPIGRENFSQSFFGSSGTIYGPSPVAVHIGLSRFFGTTEPSLRSPKELQPYVLVGVGGARTIGTITDRSSDPRSFVGSAAPPGLYPELAVGLQVGRAVAVQATYRHIEQTQEAFGLVQHWQKDSGLAQVLFEVPYGVGHVHPYVGIGAAFDKLHFTDEDFG